MFEQHPVPQQISSYQFRLVGDMTLKQFFQLAGGGVVALLFYASPLPGFLKWPAVIFFGIAGAAMAFLPIEERPLEQWVIAFFRSIYSPTIFNWEQTRHVYFQDASVQTQQVPQQQAPQQLPQELKEKITPKNTAEINLDETEERMLTKVESILENGHRSASNTPPIQQTHPAEENQPMLIPNKGSIKIETQTTKDVQPETKASTDLFKGEAVSIKQEEKKADTTQAPQAQFSAQAAPPAPPIKENVVVGQVMDSDGKIVESAILEIKDAQGKSVRAIRTNKVGHFLTVTPLPNGFYKIYTEKEGLEFDPVSFEANGKMIPAIALKAKNSIDVSEKQT